jgi:hypothetical protein
LAEIAGSDFGGHRLATAGERLVMFAGYARPIIGGDFGGQQLCCRRRADVRGKRHASETFAKQSAKSRVVQQGTNLPASLRRPRSAYR